MRIKYLKVHLPVKSIEADLDFNEQGCQYIFHKGLRKMQFVRYPQVQGIVMGE